MNIEGGTNPYNTKYILSNLLITINQHFLTAKYVNVHANLLLYDNIFFSQELHATNKFISKNVRSK